MRDPAVYLLANRRMGTLYVGVTGNLIRRVGQHRSGIEGGFACRYGLARLVWFEQHVEMRPAGRQFFEACLVTKIFFPMMWKITLQHDQNRASILLGVSGAMKVVKQSIVQRVLQHFFG